MLIECLSCGAKLPLRRAQTHERGVDWVCKSCESVYHAVLVEECPEEIRAGVLPTAFRFNEREIPLPPRELIKAVRSLVDKANPDDKRRQARRVISVPIFTLPLSENLHPIGEPFMTMSRNISASGICLMSERPIEAAHVAIQLPRVGDQTIQVAMEIIRTRTFEGFTELAGKFVTRMFA